jgi:transcriptional regulator
MYTPAHFAETRPEVLHQMLRRHPLGMLVTHGPNGLDANHIPFEFNPAAGTPGGLGLLTGHVARANPVWQLNPSGTPVLVVFRGAEAYVSPSWYPSKHLHHRQVPTWNYEVVHAHGLLQVHDDPRTVRGIVARLTRHHEAAEPRPWKMGDSPPEFIDTLVQAIVGITVQITRLEGKRKLSQNKDATDRSSAADTLQQRGREALASAMRETLDPKEQP